MRNTLARDFVRSGTGLHGGQPCRAELRSAPSGHGVRINGIRATLSSVTDARLGTTLGRVGTVEHLLAALYVLEVDDVDVRVVGGEVPILDGSAAPWTEVAVTEQFGTRSVLRPTERVEVRDGDAFVRIEPADALVLDVSVDFPGVGVQHFVTTDPRECLDARTFGYASDANVLRSTGRALGASHENVLVLDDDGQPTGAGGWRHPDELARHKCLDLLGDLALFGCPLVARVTASCAGHALHHALVRATNEAFREESR